MTMKLNRPANCFNGVTGGSNSRNLPRGSYSFLDPGCQAQGIPYVVLMEKPGLLLEGFN